MTKLGSRKLHIYSKVTKIWSIIGHRIDYNGVVQVPPPPPPAQGGGQRGNLRALTRICEFHLETLEVKRGRGRENLARESAWGARKRKERNPALLPRAWSLALRDGPLEKWLGGGGRGDFQLARIFFFAHCFCRNIFFQVNTSARNFFFRQILLFFEQWSLDSLTMFLCFINFIEYLER